MHDQLAGKRILVVDDESDVIETLKEILSHCIVDSAPDFETARKFLKKNTYDAAILDIMGVRGYALLDLAEEKGIPCLMLTAHALSSDDLVRSIRRGARAYVPKQMLMEISVHLASVLGAENKGIKHGGWFQRLRPFFDSHFKDGWQEKDKEFWREFEETYRVSKDEMEEVM